MSPAKRNLAIAAAVIVVAVAGFWLARGHVQFDWDHLRAQLASVDWLILLVGAAAIYLSAMLRGFRWHTLMGREHRGSGWKLIPAQFAGFTAIALFGRVADLTRPYMIARRTSTAVATQLAVYSIERAFDLAAAAILFSVTLLLAPRDMPHHSAFVRAGVLSFAATLFLAAFAVAVRFAGEALAAMARRLGKLVSPDLAEAASTKILEFRDGLRAIASFGQFAVALVWSLLIWGLIAAAYFTSARAFRGSPELAGITVPQTMLMMATSMGGSLLQLPVLGWFTQIGVLGAALNKFLGVPLEAASACGTLMFAVTTLSVIPGGLIAARFAGVALRTAARDAERAEDQDSV